MQPARRHDIDALRVLAFGLLILYHLGMLYVADWDFHLKSQHTAEWLQVPMIFLNRWRMELLFLISGLAVHFLRGHASLPSLAWKRSLRLLLPLIFGMGVVVPIQPYVQGVANGLVQPGFGAFLLRYWTGGPWPAGAFDGWQYSMTWNHLWYLAYLWNYTLILLIALPLLESAPVRRLREKLEGLHSGWLLTLPALPLLAAGMLADRHPMTHALVGDWFAHALYGTVFFYGYLLGTSPRLWTELRRLRHVSLALALASFALFIFLDRHGNLLIDHPLHGSHRLIATLVVRGMMYLYTWTALTCVLGMAYRWLNRPFRWLPWGRDAVYPWYILHQSVMLALAGVLLPLGLGPIGEPLAILAGTVGGCALGYAIIHRTPWLRPLFGLARKPATPAPRPALQLADDMA